MKKSAISFACLASVVQAAAAADGGSGTAALDGLEEVIVTAQKRVQSITDVAMSITALSGDDLARVGVNDAADLMRVVPGFTFIKTADSFPLFSVRGIGFFDSNLGTIPTVTAYVDEVPLPYAVLAGGATLDLERVEVLKGPQGTLFGQNSTGGALNFVAAKPTDTFEAGADVSYGRFGMAELDGFLSGPLGKTLRARFAVRHERGDDWQRSYTRHDSLGAVDKTAARLLLDWSPNETLDVELNLNGWLDSSDAQAVQPIGLAILLPGAQDPRLATGDGSPGNPLVQVYPNAPRDSRAADWTPGKDFSADHAYWQASLRANYDFGGATLTSITSYQDLDYDVRFDADGTALRIVDLKWDGLIEAFSQELRVSGESGALNWVIGGNYMSDRLSSIDRTDIIDFSLHYDLNILNATKARTSAGFANVEYRIADPLSVQAGIRYTEFEQDFHGCAADNGDGTAAGLIGFLSELSFQIPASAFLPGECYTINDLDDSVPPNEFRPAEAFLTNEEHNASWRVGVNYQPSPDSLLYANVSKGFKHGSYPQATPLFASLLVAPDQESVVAYETGFKLTRAEGALQLNGAVFYYDYQDKQLLFPYVDPVIGIQEILRNIPESRVIGAELEVSWRPVQGLILHANGTYVDSEVRSDFSGPTTDGSGTINIQGEPFPYTPEWQVAGNADYRFALSQSVYGSVGGSLTYRSETVARFAESPLFDIDGYTLLDLRAGIEASDRRWSVQIWGRNVTDKYYRVNVQTILDTIVAVSGRPVTYGITLGMRF